MYIIKIILKIRAMIYIIQKKKKMIKINNFK